MSALAGVHAAGGYPGGCLFIRRRSRGRVGDQVSRADRNRLARVQRAVGPWMEVRALPSGPAPRDTKKWQRAFWGIGRDVAPEPLGSWRAEDCTWTLPPGCAVPQVDDAPIPGRFWQGVARLDGGDQ